MTVAIAVFGPKRGEIVTVSDARLSYGEIIPAADNATMKNRKLARRWGMMFAAEYGSGIKLAIERGWLVMHDSGIYVTFTPAGAELFA